MNVLTTDKIQCEWKKLIRSILLSSIFEQKSQNKQDLDLLEHVFILSFEHKKHEKHPGINVYEFLISYHNKTHTIRRFYGEYADRKYNTYWHVNGEFDLDSTELTGRTLDEIFDVFSYRFVDTKFDQLVDQLMET